MQAGTRPARPRFPTPFRTRHWTGATLTLFEESGSCRDSAETPARARPLTPLRTSGEALHTPGHRCLRAPRPLWASSPVANNLRQELLVPGSGAEGLIPRRFKRCGSGVDRPPCRLTVRVRDAFAFLCFGRRVAAGCWRVKPGRSTGLVEAPAWVAKEGDSLYGGGRRQPTS